ncbi:MAG: methyltransferase [Bacteroidetes bacterium]|nr:methyltransferase [Bacteroidota bacterium]
MSQQTFVFKQFSVHQHKSAHKVGTDAVLIGAWAEAQQAQNILDIGTGTGIIALMMAQKSQAYIDAIDIERGSFEQAQENAQHSIWADRIKVYQTSLQNLAKDSEKKYDLIITNPPYFVDSSKAPDEERSHARHTDTLSFSELILGVKILLQKKGVFYIILPTKEAIDFKKLAEKSDLYLKKWLRVKTKSTNEKEKRHIMQFAFAKEVVTEQTMSIEHEGRHNYTDEYKNLTKDFYIHF